MVFESIVVEVLNRFLGDYVENLDSKQLKIGIWGGDVQLSNLILKSTALDDLDLPVQIVYGRLGKLVLKIPWKNLYGAAVEASIDGLYMLVVPSQQVKYDAVKDEDNAFKSKQAELQRIEDVKKKEAEKNKPKPDDSFVEKLTAQIIKNVQLTVSNIHIRYEDKVTHLHHPFAMGITLSTFKMETTDESWKPTFVQEMVTKIYKSVCLEGLAVYWNSNSVAYASLPAVDLLHRLRDEIAARHTQPEKYCYLLGPINSSARLRLNPKPDCDVPAFSIPKVHLNLEMEKLFIGISKSQYQDIIALAESLDRMTCGLPYRKFRPNVLLRGNVKEWWHFAYNSVIYDIRRQKQNWDWQHIKKHRAMLKDYAVAYQVKLTKKKIPKDVEEQLLVYEKQLDVFNIVIVRQKVEVDVARLGKVQETEESKSWFGSWWSSGKKDTKESPSNTNIMQQFEAAMTPDEKSRLYQAIDYQENSVPLDFPEAYVDNSCTFVLRLLEIQINDESCHIARVMSTELKGVKCRLDTRPAAAALKVAVNIDEFVVLGLEQEDMMPQLVTSKTYSEEQGSLLDVMFETNPLDKECSQRIHVNAKPLKIIYDALTINKLVDVFHVQESTALDQLSAAAGNRLSNIKEMSAVGLQHAIQQHSVLDLNVNLHAPYVIIPYGGRYTGIENVLVINLGNIQISTDNCKSDQAEIRHLIAKGVDKQDVLEQMINMSYDRFILQFTDLQIVLAQGGEDWSKCINESAVTPLHLLCPITLNLTFYKCLITDDPRLPLAKVQAQLPSIAFNITDVRLLLLVALGTSIPLPSAPLPENKPLVKSSRSRSSSLSILRMMEAKEKAKTLEKQFIESERNDFVQFTTLEANFVMEEMSFAISHQDMSSSPSEEVASFKLSNLECNFVQQTYNTDISVKLGGIGCVQQYNDQHLNVISTPVQLEAGEYLFNVQYLQVDKANPEFRTKYNSCESALNLELASINILLHQQGILALMKFGTDLQAQINDVVGSFEEKLISSALVGTESNLKRKVSSVTTTVGNLAARASKTPNLKWKSESKVIETIIFKLTMSLKELSVLFARDEEQISLCAIKGITTEIILKKLYTQITAKLCDLAILDLNTASIHSEIITVSNKSEDALSAQVVMYNEEHKEVDPSGVDISVQATMGCLRIVYLNWFVSNMMDFINQFQAAQNAIVEASQAAAKSAKQNMQSVYENTTRLSLNISLKAPNVIVPVSSQSYDALLLDMGHIVIKNYFVTLDVKNEQNQCVVVDEMKLKLSNLMLARTNIQNGNKNTLVEPITFLLHVKRNLSTSWYNVIPDMDVSGSIDQIMLNLSHFDYQMIMSILSGNLTEGIKSPTQLPTTSAQTYTKSDMYLSEMLLSKPSGYLPSELNIKSITMVQIEENRTKIYTSMKFKFTMDHFIINLFSGGSDKGTIYDNQNSLAHFGLEVLSVKGRMLSDGSIATAILLVNCILDDSRKGSETKLRRLLERKPDEEDSDSESSQRSMLDVTVQMKQNNIFVDVRIFSFTLILSMDYLMKLAEFFTEGQQQLQKHQPQHQQQKSISAAPTSITSLKTKNRSTTVRNDQTEQTSFTLNLRIEKPDIVLVEHMDSIDTNALILNTDMVLKLRMANTHQVISGSINDIHLYTCCYDPTRRSETKSTVLHPVSISLAGSTPEGKGLHVEVYITDVRIRVSPATIELLNRVYATMNAGSVTTDESEKELEDYSSIWNFKSYQELDYWFLKPDVAEDAFEVIGDVESEESVQVSVVPTRLKELCIVSLPSLVITIEAGVGRKTFPMLLLESRFQGTVNDWSSELSIEASLTLQIGYYNSRLALWEPLIEPVETYKDNKLSYEPWELNLEVYMHDDQAGTPQSSETEVEQVTKPALMGIEISSKYNLEATITKTSLEVFNNLSSAFSSAIAAGPLKATQVSAPFRFKNHTGFKVMLCLDKGAFKVFDKDSTQVVLESGAEVELQLKPSLDVDTTLHLAQVISARSETTDRFLYVEFTDNLKCILELPVSRADKRYFPLQFRSGNDKWGVVSAITVDEGVTIVTLKSILEVHNHFNYPVDVYYMTARGNELECISTVEPGSSLNIPLKAVYTPTNELFFSISGYSVTTVPFIWKDLQLNISSINIMHCMPKTNADTEQPFIIKAVGETEQIFHENTSRHTMVSTCYNIHLYTAVNLQNCLPVDLICCVQNVPDEHLVKPGELLQMPNVDPGKSSLIIRLPNYLDREWSCQQQVVLNAPAFSVWPFDSHDGVAKASMDLGMHVSCISGRMSMLLYCPFWMLNKTGLMLGYRKSKKAEKEASSSPSKVSEETLNVLYHPPSFKGPIMFSFNAKNFFGKKKASVRVDQGEWSDRFSLDVAGSSGVVVCQANSRIYQIGVHNQLTYNGLTKQVTFTPYYVIINTTPFDIECQESDRPGDPWTFIERSSCMALWPLSDRDDKLLKLRVVGTTEITAPFLYTETHTTLLKLTNKFGGINVDIQMTEGGVYINLAAYEQGMAPSLIINNTEDTLSIWEKETVQLRHLKPGHQFLYTWENPSGSRVLVWDIGHKKEMEDDLRKDCIGEFSPTANKPLYWVSFLDGMQRVLLFTSNKSVALNVNSSKQFEVIQQEIIVSIHGLGLSLINNLIGQEIMYIGIASSGIIWETCKMNSKRFKGINEKDNQNFEKAFQAYLIKEDTGPEFGRVLVDPKTEVDFETGLMLKPHKRRIRRTFQTGLWLCMKTNPHQLQLHAKINRLQIDNQMSDCIFPVVLAPVPPPKSVAVNNSPKPFAELSVVQRIIKYTQIRQFKYFKILIQEFHVKVDLGFVNGVLALLETSEQSEEDKKQLFLKDVSLVDEPLLSLVSSKSLEEQKNFYDLLHFSPLKIHVSFSLASGGAAMEKGVTPNFINVLLQGLGVTLTDMQDVVFKLAYFEREYTFLTQRDLISAATTHYVGQSVKQLYVLVLGLDVLGNPYGLVLGITKGVEDLFYEPFQGAIQGPGEFAEGLVLGVRSLFGHTVGGAAGAVSRITGAMGKGIAVLTFDKDYQRKRRDQINKKPATVQEGIARGGKGLVMGVFDGITGVVTKPIAGAKEEGVEGFFKGLGKGAVGLITRPAAGVVDFASGSLDAVKRATELSEDVNRLRPPRYFYSDGLVRPYCRKDADGHKILHELEKGKYSSTDIYSAHFIIIDKKEILLLTDKRLVFVSHNDIFGGWQVEWSYTWQDLQLPPKIVPKGVAVATIEEKRKKSGLFGSSDHGKIILIGDVSLKEQICSKLEELMTQCMSL